MKKMFILGNGVDWCSISLRGLTQRENVFLINEKFPMVNNIKVAKAHFSKKINRYFDFPLKSIWFRNVKNFIVNNISTNDEIVLVVFDWNFFGGEKQFVNYVRHAIKKIKIVYLFTNIIKASFAYQRGYVEKLTEWYDLVFAFDPEDAKRLHLSYSPLIYDPDPKYKKEDIEQEENTVFYVGQAKDRIKGLISCYEKLKELEIKCDFHIANVSDEEIRYSEEIIYNQFITYTEAVNSVQKSNCLLDVVQGDSTGLTIKVCEAICYHKKLITTNKHIADYSFFDPRYILIIDNGDDIMREFFENNKTVKYSEDAVYYFSGDRFWNQVWSELTEKSLRNYL